MSVVPREKIMAQMMEMVEAGMDPESIAKKLQAEHRGEADDSEEEVFPDEVRVVSQALAFRNACNADKESIFSLLSVAYAAEVSGPESFRSAPAVGPHELDSLFSLGEGGEDTPYQWLVVEAPSGKDVESDGCLLGACCYSVDGVSRRNGVLDS